MDEGEGYPDGLLSGRRIGLELGLSQLNSLTSSTSLHSAWSALIWSVHEHATHEAHEAELDSMN